MSKPEDIRNVILISHAGAGKTSLSEAILFNTGTTTRLGSVDQGNTVSDYSKDEIDRKVSISLSVLQARINNKLINLIDIPGYADFIGDLISGLKAADSAIIVVDAIGGIEVGTDKAWNLLNEKNTPRAIFINKLDKENADFFKTIESIRNRFGKKCVAMTFPVGKEASFKSVVSLLPSDGINSLSGEDKENAKKYKDALLETVAEGDDKLIEKYLEGGELTTDEVEKGLMGSIMRGDIVPVCCGSATNNIGVKELAEALIKYMPSPAACQPKVGKDAEGKEISRKPSVSEPFCAQVFKTILDPYVGQLTIFRVFSGNLTSNTSFYNASKSTKERIGQIYFIHGKEQRGVESVQAGDIAAVTKLKTTETGDSICDEKAQINFDPIVFPEPAISRSVKPKSKGDEDKISVTLHKMSSEDPTFRISRDAQTKELIAAGVGDLHIEIMINRIKDRFNVGVELGTPKVAYKETIKKTAKVQGKYKRQTGGHGQYGDVWLEVEPLPKGGGFEFVDNIVGGAIPRNYIPSVEKGVVQAMSEGIIAGYPVSDIRVTLYDGSYHEVDSSDMAFQIAGAMAFRKATLEAGPVLLEPIMDVEITVPEEYMGDVTGNINARRGRIMGMGAGTVQVQVPLVEMFKYATELRSMTGGRGSYTMKFSHYEEVPAKIAGTIIAQAQVAKKEEESK